VIGVLHEARVDLHLAREYGLQLVGHVLPRRDLVRPVRQRRVVRNHTQLLLAGEGLIAKLVPALVELAFVLGGPLVRHVMGCVRGARREVDEERLVGHERLLLAHPRDRAVGDVLGEVVPVLGRSLGLHRSRPLVERGEILVRFAADEAVEVLEPSAAARPAVERSHRARLPDRNLVALAELRRRVPVQLERLRKGSAGLRTDRAVARRGRRELGDPAHANRVVVSAGEERLSGRRAEGGRVEAVEPEPGLGEPLRRRRVAWAAECTRGSKPRIVDQHDENVRGAGRRS
jgi:hypothetical protein